MRNRRDIRLGLAGPSWPGPHKKTRSEKIADTLRRALGGFFQVWLVNVVPRDGCNDERAVTGVDGMADRCAGVWSLRRYPLSALQHQFVQIAFTTLLSTWLESFEGVNAVSRSLLSVDGFGFLPSGVGNNKQLLTACIWVFLLEDRNVNQVVRSDVCIHPFNSAFKNMVPLDSFVIKNLDVVRSVGRCSRAREPCGLNLSFSDVLSRVCQA